MWSSILRVLQMAGPEKLEGGAIPRVGGNLATSVLAFVSALRAGDLAKLLGQEVTHLLEDPVHHSLAKDLIGDLPASERPLVESSSGSWRALFVPLLDGQELRQIRFFMRRRDRSNEDDDPERDNERFVVEAELGATGPLQLDGLVGKSRFDLVVRTLAPLPPAWRDDIRRIFEESGELTGIRGGLTFQAVPDFPVKPLEEDPALDGGLLA